MITMKHNSPTMYFNTLKTYILEATEENLIEKAEIVEVKEPTKVIQKELVEKVTFTSKKEDVEKIKLAEIDKNGEVLWSYYIELLKFNEE